MRTATGQTPTSTPPKLSLFSLPIQPPEPPGMLTPPLHASISVPFHWEEEPGKPRSFEVVESNSNSKPKSVRSLDLPPRLFTDAKVAHFASPTTAALDRDLSFRFPDSWAEAEAATATVTDSREGRIGKYIGSRRWMSFRKNKEIPKGGSEITVSDGGAEGDTRVKITRFRSRRSFFRSSNSKSHLIASIYGSLKQVIPWRRKQDEMGKVAQ